MVKLEQVQFRWKIKAPLLLDITDLSIKQGEKVFIKGASGSGKSTLLNLIAGVIKPQFGKVWVSGTNLSALPSVKRDIFRADHIGFIFQMFNLIPYLSVLENVTLPLDFSKDRRQKVKEVGKIREEASRLLEQLGLENTLQTRKVTDLSIGQQQRVAAARAMIGSPPLLIADEPTSALDADTREVFLQLIFEECKQTGMTLLFVSHDGQLESLFDRSLALKDINNISGEA